MRAAIAVLSFPDLDLHALAVSRGPIRFPYVPGYLSFRELPLVLQALEKLTKPPDLLLCDGQGLAHPRRFGLACHLGVLTDIPTIGVAKSRLIGTHKDLSSEKGQWVPLIDKGETVGAVVRTSTNVSPVYVSIGRQAGPASKINSLQCQTR
jgi:deoxyribonuclease V